MDDITASIIVACQTDGATAAVDKLKYSFVQLARQAYNFGKEAIKAYSDLQEETQKFGLVFEKMNHQAKRYVKDLVDNFGQSELSARKMMSSTGDLLKGWGFEDKDIVEMSGAVARLGADIASFSNYSGGAENATIALTKAMLGETEMAKMLGVAIKTDTPEFRKLEKQALSTGITIDKLGKSFKAETASQAKAVAAFATMYQQKGYVLGDFARNQNSIANSARTFENRMKDLKIAVGDFLDSFLNASGINKGLAGFVKSITDTINKNKVSWGLQIKTVFIEIEYGLKRTLAAIKPVTDLFVTTFNYMKGIGQMIASGGFDGEKLQDAIVGDLIDRIPGVMLMKKITNSIWKEQGVNVKLRKEYGMPYNASEEEIHMENLRRLEKGLPKMDLSYQQMLLGGRVRKLAESLNVELPKVELKFDFKEIERNLNSITAEYEKAKKEAEESFRRRYVDENSAQKSPKDQPKTQEIFGPVITADIAKALFQFRATTQSAIDANSIEGMRLQSRRLSLGKPEEWTKKTADGVATIVGQLREIGKSVMQKSAVTVRPPEVRAGDTAVTVQAPDGKAQTDFSWGLRTADGVATIVGQLREIGKNVMQKSAVTVRPPEVRAGDTAVTVQTPESKAQADFSWGQRTADSVATIVGQLREIGKSVAVPHPTALRIPEMPRPAASVPVIAPKVPLASGQAQSPVVWSEILAQLKALVAQASNTTGDVEIIARQVSNISTNGLKMSLNTRKY